MTPLADFKGKIISEKYVYSIPNPARGRRVKLVIHARQAAEIKCTLFTPSSREVLSFSKSIPAGKSVEEVNLGELSNGVYLWLVKARAADGTEERVVRKMAYVR